MQRICVLIIWIFFMIFIITGPATSASPSQMASGSTPFSSLPLPAGACMYNLICKYSKGQIFWVYVINWRRLICTVHTDDQASHHEGDVTHPESMRPVWINEGYVIRILFCVSIWHWDINNFNCRNKLEPAQASQFITKSIQAHFPGPIHQFSDFLIDVQDLLFDMFMVCELCF